VRPLVMHLFPSLTTCPSRSTLFHQLLAANSLDFILDFTITIASVFLAYCSPIFLRLILETIQSGTTRREAALGFVYAGLMFFTGILKAQLDVKHLWHSRRITTRMRSELMAALYDKALKRKDFSGVAQDRTLPGAGSSGLSKKGDEAKAKSGEDVKKGKQLTTDAGGDTKKDGHKKAGGGIGKIVQLMTGDASRIAETVGRLDFLYVRLFLTVLEISVV
jgi:ABC-type multidrug transport system fused ATPase/permease subunit